MYEFILKNKFFLLLLILLLFGIGISIFSLDDYEKHNKKHNKKHKKHIKLEQDNFNNKPSLSLYYANWCGHCKSFKPTWEEIINDENNKHFVNFNTVDCSGDKPETSINKTPNGTEIDGFPTIIFSKNGRDIVYNGQRSKNSLEEFIQNN